MEDALIVDREYPAAAREEPTSALSPSFSSVSSAGGLLNFSERKFVLGRISRCLNRRGAAWDACRPEPTRRRQRKQTATVPGDLDVEYARSGARDEGATGPEPREIRR